MQFIWSVWANRITREDKYICLSTVFLADQEMPFSFLEFLYCIFGEKENTTVVLPCTQRKGNNILNIKYKAHFSYSYNKSLNSLKFCKITHGGYEQNEDLYNIRLQKEREKRADIEQHNVVCIQVEADI